MLTLLSFAEASKNAAFHCSACRLPSSVVTTLKQRRPAVDWASSTQNKLGSADKIFQIKHVKGIQQKVGWGHTLI